MLQEGIMNIMNVYTSHMHVCIIPVLYIITNIITKTKVRIITSPCSSPVLQPVLMI